MVAAIDSVSRRPDEEYLDLIRRAAADLIGRVVKLADNAHNSSEERLALLAPGVAPGRPQAAQPIRRGPGDPARDGIVTVG